jgi:hypothetical protein
MGVPGTSSAVQKSDIEYIRRHLALGTFVLFTGAGFSSGCLTKDGVPLPIGTELRRLLWPHAFPGSAFEETESLGEIFEVAMRQDHSGLKATLDRVLTIDPSTVPAWYRAYMHGPWFRIYTLNFDDFWDVARHVDPLARSLTTVSAISDETLPPDACAAVIHLNGRLNDFPNVTFSPRQYGERQAVPDKWYAQLVSDLFGSPVLFVGTQLNEPPFWEYLALRRQKEKRRGERRPKSFLVTPHLGPAKREILRDLNIALIECDAQAFAESILTDLDEQAAAGRTLLAHRRSASRSDRVIEDVAVLRSGPPPALYDARSFLLGRQPVWKDFESGYAVERDFDLQLAAAIAATDDPIIVTGTAGTGKSTSLMRAALRLHNEGHKVLWFDGKDETELRLWQLRNRVKDARAEYLFVDDADAFGPRGGSFLADAASDNPGLHIVAAARSSRLRAANLEPGESFDGFELVVPGLTDDDIDLLLGALDAANRLGYLKGKPHPEQVKIFRKSFDRQLLVAMLEATSGVHFEELIKSECGDLDGIAYDLYAMGCLATSLRSGLKRDELVLACAGDTAAAVGELRHLLDRRLLVTDSRALIWARHRVIAEHTIDQVKNSGHLGQTIEGLVFALATKVSPQHDANAREHRLLVHLINHDYLISALGEPSQIRPIFSTIEEILSWDFHYWLQRGSYEVERGSISSARNFLAQAKALAPDNFYVLTEWAYMLLVEAAREAEGGQPLHRQHAEEAMAELFDIIEAHGHETPYPYHVLAKQGMDWLERADLTAMERARYLGEILSSVRDGMRKHRRSSELRTIETAVEKAYLLTSVRPT